MFFEYPASTIYSTVYLSIFVSITLFSVLLTILDSVQSIQLSAKLPLEEIDYVIYAIFTVDFILRMICCPNQRAFWFNIYNFLDFLSLLPFYLHFIFGIGDNSFMQLIYLLRSPIRLLTLSRNFFGFKLLTKSLSRSVDSLPIPLFLLFLMVISGGIFIYFFEHQSNPLIDSIPQAMYLSIVTITTVGFGDIVPLTVAGKITVSVLIVTGVLYMAMPLAIVGSNFLQVWEERDRILLIKRVKERLVEFGFSPNDLVHAFQSFDSDNDGDIDIEEFSVLVKSLRLGLSQDRIVDLFASFDTDENGSLRLAEFARAVFPNHIWTDDELRVKEIELFSRDVTFSQKIPTIKSTDAFVDNVEEGRETTAPKNLPPIPPSMGILKKISFRDSPVDESSDVKRRLDELTAQVERLSQLVSQSNSNQSINRA